MQKINNDVDRFYKIEDTIIEKALRRCPPAPVFRGIDNIFSNLSVFKKTL